jgi:hypothetical protein
MLDSSSAILSLTLRNALGRMPRHSREHGPLCSSFRGFLLLFIISTADTIAYFVLHSIDRQWSWSFSSGHFARSSSRWLELRSVVPFHDETDKPIKPLDCEAPTIEQSKRQRLDAPLHGFLGLCPEVLLEIRD